MGGRIALAAQNGPALHPRTAQPCLTGGNAAHSGLFPHSTAASCHRPRNFPSSAEMKDSRASNATLAIVASVILMVGALLAVAVPPIINWLNRPPFTREALHLPYRWSHEGTEFEANVYIGRCNLDVTLEVLSPPERHAEGRQHRMIMAELSSARLVTAPEAPLGLSAAILTAPRLHHQDVHSCRTGDDAPCPEEVARAVIPVPPQALPQAEALLAALNRQLARCASPI